MHWFYRLYLFTYLIFIGNWPMYIVTLANFIHIGPFSIQPLQLNSSYIHEPVHRKKRISVDPVCMLLVTATTTTTAVEKAAFKQPQPLLTRAFGLAGSYFWPSGQPPWLVWFGGYSAILVLLHKTKSLLLLLCWGKAVDIGRGRDRSGRMTRSLCVMHKINAFGLTLAGRLGLNEFL